VPPTRQRVEKTTAACRTFPQSDMISPLSFCVELSDFLKKIKSHDNGYLSLLIERFMKPLGVAQNIYILRTCLIQTL
jgi:hypothetical protein